MKPLRLNAFRIKGALGIGMGGVWDIARLRVGTGSACANAASAATGAPAGTTGKRPRT